MDKKQSQNKSSSSRLSAAEQQQLAMLQQLGIPMDPSMLAYGLQPGFDPQQLLNPMATAGYPFMNSSAALQAFAGLGGLGAQSGAAQADLWNLAQNQALAASLGAGYLPGMIPGYPMVPPDSLQDSKSLLHRSTAKSKEEKEKPEKPSGRSESASPSVSRLSHGRKASHESSASKDRPDSHHSTSSPFRAGSSKQNDFNSSSSWLEGLNNQRQQKLNEQVLQAELMRQFEQQFMLQQLQIQQQQQQDQINAALQSVLTGGSLPGSSSGSQKKASSDAGKMQEQMAAMMQLMQAGGMQGMTPAMASSLFSTPGALETMMAMSQLGGGNTVPGLGIGNQVVKEDIRAKSSTSQRNSSHSSQKAQKYDFPSSSGTSKYKKREQSSSPSKTDQHNATKNNQLFPIPGIPGPGLSADDALLAMMYSQHLQYQELAQQQISQSKSQNDGAKSSPKHDAKTKTSIKDEMPHSSSTFCADSPSSHSRANMLHSPTNSSSSRGLSHASPAPDFTKSPSNKIKDSELSQSRSSSTKQQQSISSKPSTSKNYGQESMADTLKLFSALASNPNLTQQELAALLSFPTSMDPTALLAGMGPSAAALLDPSLAAASSPAELEKLNKNLAIALAYEQQKIEDQMKRQLRMENNVKKGSDNHISVIHQNLLKSDRPSSRHSLGRGKRSSVDTRDGVKLGNGDAASSDGDVRSEASNDKSSTTGKFKRRRVITDEDEIWEPLKHGWKREIRFKLVGNQLRGEVVYIAPGGRKFRTFPDVLKYLDDNNITNISRNNFSFSSRLRIGSFFEQKDRDKGNRQWHEMTEVELDQRIRQFDRGQCSSPFPDNSDQMSNYSSSSKGESRASKKEKEKERQIEQLRVLKEQKELRRLEQQRMEREIRERIAYEELERQRVEEAKQQMLLMRALEARKRAEERERRKEEQRIEKMLQRERKMEQRRIAMQIARELKMPVEDMSTIGAPQLPDLTRLQGTYDNKCPHQLSGNACADLLMVLEFVKTFKDCIRLDDSTVPTFEQLQLALLNDPKHTPVLVNLTVALLHQCLCDPGVPAPGPWLHCLTGVKVTDIDVTADNYSEILRLFIWARSGFKTEIAVTLETLPFLSLTTDEKATSLAFLVNELVCSRPICMEIEKNLDNLATLRRDKWMVEGQIRQLRIAYEKNPGTDSPIIKLEDDDNSSNSYSSKPLTGELMKEESLEESSESLYQKRMDELTQQQTSYNVQLAHSTKPLRALDLGQDRYKRRYWVLPNLGGVYVEGLESGISYEDDDESPDEDEDDEEEELKKIETNTQNNGSEIKSEYTVESKTINDPIDTQTSNTYNNAKEEPVGETKGNVEAATKNDSTVNSQTSDTSTANAIVSNSVNVSSTDIQQSLGNSEKNHHEIENGVTNIDTECDGEKQATLTQEHDTGVVTVPNYQQNNTAPLEELKPSGLDENISNNINHSPDKLPDANMDVTENMTTPTSKTDSSGSIVNKSTVKSNSFKEGDNDSVMAAAKAIAAKAVASSSHLLFPDGSPTKTKSRKDPEPEKQKEKMPYIPDTVNNSLPIGELTINALVQMGVNPTSLTSQQLEVLSHMDIPVSVRSKLDELQLKSNSVSETDKQPTNHATKQELTKDHEDSAMEKQDENPSKEEAPIDLTCSVPTKESSAKSEPIPAKAFPVKSEAPSQRDSPFIPVRDSPDHKFIDNKFFVPISFSNNNGGDVKPENQSYNQTTSSCPSPNTLANCIISSVNYGQFPPLDDIKFPIRAPDVKEEPDAIPREKKRGWWRMQSEGELRSLSEKLHMRGIREKQLHRNITKNFEACTNSMAGSALPEHHFAVLSKESTDTKETSEQPKLTDVEKLKKSTRSSSQERNVQDAPSRFITSDNSAYEAEMQVLYQAEDLAAKCVSMAVVSPLWRSTNPKLNTNSKELTHIPLGPLRDGTGVEIKFDIMNPIYHDPRSALGAAVNFVGCLERAVYRRYLKPPLVRKGGASEFSSLPSLSESGVMDVAAGLRTWRNAIASASSASQLALCVRMLETCIAWDRSANNSPSKADTSPGIKSKKRKVDKRTNSAKMLISPDDSPIHQPKKRRKKKPNAGANSKKVKRMPIDTADVISKTVPNSNEEELLPNGTISYNDTPDQEPLENNFNDSVTSSDSQTEVSQNGPTEIEMDEANLPQYITHAGSISEEYRPNAELKKKKKKKKKAKLGSKDEPIKKPKPKKRADKDALTCRNILKELQSHEDATWFLFPVDCKLVPGYRKIIKKPIDFHTIESRLKRGRYKSKDEFVCEIRLVFDNCRRFNEDDSNIGRAGHQLREFFERRWAEVLLEKYGETVAPIPLPDLQFPSYPPVDEEESNSVPEEESEPVSESPSYNDSENGGLMIDDS